MAQKAAEQTGSGGEQERRPYGWTGRDTSLALNRPKVTHSQGEEHPEEALTGQEMIGFTFGEHFSGHKRETNRSRRSIQN